LQELINVAKPDAKLIFLGTAWSPLDAWGWIERAVKYRGGSIRKYPASSYWTQLFDAELLEDKRNNLSPVLYACNYELTYIKDDSLLFKDPHYGPFDPESWRTHPVFMHVDAAFGGSDFTAFTVYCNRHVLGKAYRKHVKECYRAIADLYREYHCRYILVESNADKGYVAADLRSLGLTAREYHESENKQVKIETYVYGVWGELVFDEKTNGEYMEQVLFYDGKTGFDDAIDSLSCCCRNDPKDEAVSEEVRRDIAEICLPW
jgi:hypothetical protein